MCFVTAWAASGSELKDRGSITRTASGCITTPLNPDWSITSFAPSLRAGMATFGSAPMKASADGLVKDLRIIRCATGFATSAPARLQDRDGDIWIGTDRGLSRLHLDKFESDAVTEALKSEKVWAIHQDPNGGLWFGTRNGGL